jgi:hypothetical protein
MDDDQLYLALAHPKAVWEAKGHRNGQKKVVIDPSSLQILDDGGDGYSFEVGPASVSLSARYNNTQKDAVRRFVEVRQSTKRFRQFWEVNDRRLVGANSGAGVKREAEPNDLRGHSFGARKSEQS